MIREKERALKRNRGFTLIEVLIVVVIIAVLAAFILPRFFGQTERGILAEAQVMLGAMARGEEKWMDMFSSRGAGITVEACGATPCSVNAQQTWTSIGMNAPQGSAKFDFGCDAVDTCTATRVGAADLAYAGSTITIKYRGAQRGQFNCTGNYTPEQKNRGCVPKGG